jgi:hypothetical protein
MDYHKSSSGPLLYYCKVIFVPTPHVVEQYNVISWKK